MCKILLISLIFIIKVIFTTSDRCESECRGALSQEADGVCERYRNMTPRPELFKRCTEGFSQG